ncbi:uncharacterized protein Hao [Planococcus citri]|uniref:uncharacterized protein Hao n=1 Tax=Planococcus citri TaxID=170843 RepID=UPI0031FA062E
MNTEASLCCVPDFQEYAFRTLPKKVLDYYRSGSCQQKTLHNNREAFDRLRIRPRMLIDASKIETSSEVLGCKVQIPFGIAPSAMQKLAHPEGEIGNAKAIGQLGGIYILSTLSTTSLEDVAAATPNTTKWFQLYVYKDRELTKKVVQRAEKAGYKALVLTVDANVFGLRYADMKNNFDLPPHLKLANFDGLISKIEKAENTSGLNSYCNQLFDQSISWNDVQWLQKITKLPVVLKGILTAEDAIVAVEHGVSAIIVSNHGGRQLDTAPASIEALPEIVRAVGNKVDVLFDGGIQYGTDIFKALALGAKMVFIGRAALWGLAYGGEKGVHKLLKILENELTTTMGLTGCQKVKDIKKEMIVHESFYHKL